MQEKNSNVSKRTSKRQLAYEKRLLKHYYLMKLSAILIKKLINFLPSQLVILTGVSCSGKSTVASELTKKDPNILHIDVDLIARSACLELIRNLYSDFYHKFYPIFGNTLAYYIFYASSNDIFSTINMVDIEDINKLQKLLLQNTKALIQLRTMITNRLLNEVKVNLVLGKIVILDLVADSETLKPFAEMMPMVITIYTPIKQLLAQISNRNKQAVTNNSPLNYRKSDSVLSQLPMFFTSRTGIQSLPLLEQFTYENFFEILSKYLKIDLHSGASTNINVNEFLTNLAKQLNIDKHKLNQLCCKEKTDIVIQADQMQATQLAKLIFNYITKQTLYHKVLPRYKQTLISSTNLAPRLIILDGLSTAGKTTTAEAFIRINASTMLLRRSERQRKLLRYAIPSLIKRMNKHGDTLFCYAKYKKNTFFRESFKIINTINKDYLEEIDRLALENQQAILLAEEKAAAEKAKKYLDAGITVILDNLIFKQDLSQFSNLSPIIVLVYCPFANILRHILYRNEEAVKRDIPTKWRDPYKVFQAYTVLFGSVNKLNYKNSLEVLTKANVVEVLEKMFSTYPAEKFGIVKDMYVNNLLEKLGLGANEKVEIYPQLTFPDLVLDTANSADENAISLLSFINESSVSDIQPTILQV